MTRLPLIGLLAATAVLASASLRAQTASAPAAAAVAAPADGLPDTPGKATLLRVCSGCHEPGVVAQQRRSESDWHDLVQLMAGNGAQGTDGDFAEITQYLAKSFPAGK
jgi:cytochrome c5